ncbi:MAG: cobalamin-dependent protein [bacterium]
MRVTFLGIGCEQLAVSLLAALARRDGHTVGLAFSAALFDDRYFLRVPALARRLDDTAAVLAAIREQRPDVLACSALTNSYRWMLAVAREAKRAMPDLQVVFGGVHASAVAERVLADECVDFVCVGEGDVAFPRLLAALERGESPQGVPNLRYRGGDGRIVAGPQLPFFADLDSLPHFDKALWERHLDVAHVYLTMASRGCPYRCTFCFNNFFVELAAEPRGKYVRQRSAEHVLEELGAAQARYGRLRLVNFQDDVFTVDKDWLAPFLSRYRRAIGAPFRCMSHPRYLDAEVARWLAEAGCVGVQVGVQSVDDEFKRASLKRYERTGQVERAIANLEQRGVPVQVDHILGLPDEPADAQQRALRFYAEHTPTRISVYWATYFPGTEMLARAVAAGSVSTAQADAIADGELIGYHDTARERASDGGGASHSRALAAYALAFRLLPLVPRSLRGRVGQLGIERWPELAVVLASWLALGAGTLRRAGVEERAYLRHYARGLVRRARGRRERSSALARRARPLLAS